MSLRSPILNVLLVLCSLVIGALGMELAGQLYVALVAKHGKLFTLDRQLGWVPLPNLDLARKNANGDLWHIATDAQGIRGPADWPDPAKTRLLVLGDSFAFGEGVELADRFDTLLAAMVPNLSVVDLGVMGYGPGQELIRGRRWIDRLRPGDVLLLLTYGNDFYDLARTRHGGRPKPWVEDEGGRLIEHPPATNWFSALRDRSYLVTLLTRSWARLVESDETEERLRDSGSVYAKLIERAAAPLMARGVRVVLAHHGDQVFPLPFDLARVFADLCPEVSACVALDPALAAAPRAEVFLEDGHWAAGGHRIAAHRLAAVLRSPPIARRDPATSADRPPAAIPEPAPTAGF